MERSIDGTILYKITNNDIKNGSFVIPDEVTTIDRDAFRDCHEDLTQLTLPANLTTIHDMAFLLCTSLTQLTFPKGLKSIGLFAFNRCTELTQLTFLGGVTTLNGGVFSGCSSLTEIHFPEGLTSISDNEFSGCTSLTQIIFPEGVTSVGHDIFNDCIALQSIIINTNSNEELERFKKLFPEEHQRKVIKNPIYAELLAFKEKSYKKVLHSPKLSGLKDDFHFFNNRIPGDIFVKIAEYEYSETLSFENTIAHYTFPTCQASLFNYKSKVNDLVNSINKQVSINLKFLSCASTLQRYVDVINEQKKIKEKRAPLFFTQNPAIALEVTDKIQAISKAINWLQGEANLSFSPLERKILSKSIVGIKLNEFNIELPLQPENTLITP